ncbi:MAG: hypothetical protein JO229_12610 [Alphaproteobacteria bacterium]|nr:hypothetical protein [Alphaproteobacteria bacterium]
MAVCPASRRSGKQRDGRTAVKGVKSCLDAGGLVQSADFSKYGGGAFEKLLRFRSVADPLAQGRSGEHRFGDIAARSDAF